MGSTQSLLSPDVVVAGALVVGTVTAATYGVYSRGSESKASSSTSSTDTGTSSKKKKKSGAEKEKAREDAAFNKALADANKAKSPTQVVPFPSIVPGTFDSDAAASLLAPTPQKPSAKKAKKKVKKTGSSGTEEQERLRESAAPVIAPVETTPTPEPPVATSSKKKKRKGTKKSVAVGKENAQTSENDPTSAKGVGSTTRPQALAESYVLSDAPEDASWTRVTSRRKNAGATDVDIHTSDTNATRTTSATADTTEDDDGEAEEEKPADTPRRTLAERMLPRPRKTGVEE